MIVSTMSMAIICHRSHVVAPCTHCPNHRSPHRVCYEPATCACELATRRALEGQAALPELSGDTLRSAPSIDIAWTRPRLGSQSQCLVSHRNRFVSLETLEDSEKVASIFETQRLEHADHQLRRNAPARNEQIVHILHINRVACASHGPA